MISNVKPTRMELLKIRKRIELAKKGHKLLKDKRDALFNEFYKEAKSAKELRKEMETVLSEAFSSLAIAQAQIGRLMVSQFALTASRTASIDLVVKERNIMGAHVPIVEAGKISRNLAERGYSIVGSLSNLDDAASLFEQSLEKIVALAEKETLLEKLAFEINKTKRKVNSLEKVTIPKMEKTKKYIQLRLEERERETIFTLKKIKKKKEKATKGKENTKA